MDMNRSAQPWYQRLATRFGLVFAAFVVVGSLWLLAWLRVQHKSEDERVFLALAQADADFVQRLKLPRSSKLAADLGQLLGMQIRFRDTSGVLEPPANTELSAHLKVLELNRVLSLPPNKQMLALRMDASHDMVFLRTANKPTLSLLHPATRNALLAFWLLSAALGWVIVRQVVGPVGRLTRGLRGFFETADQVPLEVTRGDEIGELARALTQARNDLISERLKREQSERLALLGRVATGLAHEIKNPLAAIQLHTQLMDVSTLDTESAQSLLHVQAETRVIEGLVNQWLYVTRPAPPKMLRIDVAEVLRETLETMQAQMAHAGSAASFSIDPAACTRLQGDRPRLLQAFRNVILNAVQAMPRGGKIQIHLTKNEITFHDGGAGFSESALAHGADLFFSEKEGGMGVGLNVVQEIISAHGGQIMLKNHPQGGAQMVIGLPMRDN